MAQMIGGSLGYALLVCLLTSALLARNDADRLATWPDAVAWLVIFAVAFGHAAATLFIGRTQFIRSRPIAGWLALFAVSVIGAYPAGYVLAIALRAVQVHLIQTIPAQVAVMGAAYFGLKLMILGGSAMLAVVCASRYGLKAWATIFSILLAILIGVFLQPPLMYY